MTTCAPGKVRLVFGGLAFLGPDSEQALRFALAAGRQGKLWNAVHLLYANQGPENSGWVTDELLRGSAPRSPGFRREEALDATPSPPGSTRRCELRGAGSARLGVDGTPAFAAGRTGGELSLVAGPEPRRGRAPARPRRAARRVSDRALRIAVGGSRGDRRRHRRVPRLRALRRHDDRLHDGRLRDRAAAPTTRELAGVPVAVLGLGAYVFLLGTAFSTRELARVVGRRGRRLGSALRRLPAVRAAVP